MKKLFLWSVLSTALLFTAVNCSKDDSSDNNNNNGSGSNEKAEITMKAGVEVHPAKALIGTGPISSNFAINIPIGVYANNGSWLSGATANWINNDSATVSGTAGHAVTFLRGPYYYPTNGSTLNFFAFAPQAALKTAAGAGISPVVTFSIDGQQDIMWAESIGYKQGSNAAVPPVLNFQHKLTQLQFKFISGTGYPTDGSNKVDTVFIKAQPNTVDMVVGTGVCSFSGSADIQALSATDRAAGIGIVPLASATANSPVMVPTSSSYLLDIYVKGAAQPYLNVPVTLSSATGSAHVITITFQGTGITATAAVADWINGATGSATASKK